MFPTTLNNIYKCECLWNSFQTLVFPFLTCLTFVTLIVLYFWPVGILYLLFYFRKLNSVSLQETQEPNHVHENGVIPPNPSSELEESSDFVFDPKDHLENGHQHEEDLQPPLEARDRHSTINSEEELLNGEPFLFDAMPMVQNGDSACANASEVSEDERTTKSDGGAVDAVDGCGPKLEEDDSGVFRETSDVATVLRSKESEPIPVPKKDCADKSIETSSETLVSDNLFCR